MAIVVKRQQDFDELNRICHELFEVMLDTLYFYELSDWMESRLKSFQRWVDKHRRWC